MDSVILALGVVGWGLFLTGAFSHLSHFERLVDLLVLHIRSPRRLAAVLVAAEVAIAVLIPIALLAGAQAALRVIAVAGALLGAGFAVWVVRLFAAGSSLPCACSFSTAPTSVWSVARATGTIAIGLLAFSGNQSSSMLLTALSVGAAAGAVGFVLPDALAWPDESMRLRALATGAEADH